MKLPFFSRRVRFFGNVAIMILCAVFFLVPFAFRGARMSLRTVRNDVSDWLPADFPETQELNWFREHFVGSQFIVISWPGCSEDDDRFHLLVDKIRAESLERQHEGEAAIAHEKGDHYGLHTTGDYHEDWGTQGEKWIVGRGDKWYYVTKQGELYRWTGESNLIGWGSRAIERMLHGSNRAEGEMIYQFGEPEDNEFYKDPRKLAGRFFEGVTTGPELLEQLAGPEGSLLRGRAEDNEGAALDARILAHQRLTGLMFGPTPTPGFAWTPDAFWEELPEKTREKLPDFWKQVFTDYLDEVIERDFDGSRQQFLAANPDVHLEHWMRLFDRYRVEPPARQTCLIVTLNSSVAGDLARVVGRDLPQIGKTRGRIQELAIGECEIPIDSLHLGGPPVDNVAIDEEGTITLVRLVSLSVLVGVTLAYISFRSLNVTFMVFFIGAISAVASMSIVWYLKSTPDAVLMSMPALVYVLGISGAVHIVNYYREAAHANGPRGAAETAVRHGWFPCTLAAFTTSLGLISLYASNLIPIQKFGLFSALGTMATVALLFTYLPAALQIWPPGYRKQAPSEEKQGGMHALIGKFWEGTCEFIIRRHAIVTVTSLIVMLLIGIGIFRIQTSVQLLKLFDGNAKIIQDYRWLESNLGRLVPMELVVRVNENAQFEEPIPGQKRDAYEEYMQLSFLERMEMASRVRKSVEGVFGEEGAKIVGNGLSTDVLVLPEEVTQYESPLSQTRNTTSGQIESHLEELLESGTLRIDPQTGEELWRISLRLGAFNDVDYGRFVFDLKRVVEPILTAYRHRNRILSDVFASTEGDLTRGRVLLLGWPEQNTAADSEEDSKQTTDVANGANLQSDRIAVDQTRIYSETLRDLLLNRGFQFSGRGKRAVTVIPEMEVFDKLLNDKEAFAEQLGAYDTVVLIRDHEKFDRELIEANSKNFMDATDHVFYPKATDGHSPSPSALEIRDNSEIDEHDLADAGVTYTGIVPIVYKAQRTLLRSLMDSIFLAFAMIALVMMVLLRDWRSKPTATNLLNIRGGLLCMLPNVFPVVIIFGAMGHLQVVVDIGSMMTASVAMGIAVDDTIHFMNWFRQGLRQGLSRLDAIRLAYRRVATAMTQTTFIAGFGLSVFALSTFTPTQRFGVLMLTLLAAALIGDLIFLPALLAGPLGRFFAVKKDASQSGKDKPQLSGELLPAGATGEESSSHPTRNGEQNLRNDEQDSNRISSENGSRHGTVGSPHVDTRGDKQRTSSPRPGSSQPGSSDRN